MRGSRRIIRAEGVLLVACYVAFIVFMIIQAIGS
jgi:hypothetical protein